MALTLLGQAIIGCQVAQEHNVNKQIVPVSLTTCYPAMELYHKGIRSDGSLMGKLIFSMGVVDG